jgi:DNA polymerase
MADQMRTAAPFVPDDADVSGLAGAAADCRGCDLFERATQTVFGAGASHARAMFVGEQPGDVEDREGKPFVGPAGRLLDRALADAGIDRDQVYVTNAVKHFRWRPAPRGKRRIHETPEARHVAACRPWLAAELAAVRPPILVALGAVAARALYGSGFRLTQHRGERLEWPPQRGGFAEDATTVDAAFATVHPSAILRVGPEDRDDAFAQLVHDLRVVAHSMDSDR